MPKIVLKDGKGMTQDELIRTLNPIIRGWGEYHKHICAKTTFGHVDQVLYRMLVRWAVRRHPKKGHKWIEERYWRTIGKRNWCFASDDNTLLNMSSIPIWRHVKKSEVMRTHIRTLITLKKEDVNTEPNHRMTQSKWGHTSEPP